MPFNSFPFLLFFIAITIIYFAFPNKFRWVLLLLGSYFFYMYWDPFYAIILFAVTVTVYITALLLKGRDKRSQVIILSISIVLNLATLFVFKYFNFFVSTVKDLFHLANKEFSFMPIKILLPVGISFFTFQAISYIVDVYRGKIEPNKHFGKFALFLSFFPQLVAGPIERAPNLLPQFFEKKEFDAKRSLDGMKLIAWGFFKKMVIADRIAILVDTVFKNPQEYAGLSLILAAIFFTIQLYCDFSGYSDIAIGTGQVMGYRIMINFERPFFSKTIAEFWKRWHISMTTWFRDYLYLPLGGNRVSKFRYHFNIMITFIVSGLWHGANWTYITWGGINGFYYVFSNWSESARGRIAKFLRLNRAPRIHGYLKAAITFLLSCYAFIFFRARTMSEGFYIAKNVIIGTINIIKSLVLLDMTTFLKLIRITRLGLRIHELYIVFISLIILYIVELLQRKGSIRERLDNGHVIIRWALFHILVMFILIFGVFEESKFIYFQF